MGEFVDQVCGDDHRVTQQQGAKPVQQPAVSEQQGDAEGIAAEGIGQRQAVGQLAVGVTEYGGGHSFLQTPLAGAARGCRPVQVKSTLAGSLT